MSTQNFSYCLLDSGNFKKLEKIGPYKIVRPSLQAVWDKTNPDLWNDIDASFTRYSGGEGSWKFFKNIKEEIIIKIDNINIKLKFTDFGHLGIFPEQYKNWITLSKLPFSNIDVLNLFAYTGISSLFSSHLGTVTHLDASKTTVSWAKENAELNSINNIRWIVDDVTKFLKREIKRNKKYQGIILDPPSYGRGSKGEVWKIEDDILSLLSLVSEVFDKTNPCFILLSSHSFGFTPVVLENLIKSCILKDIDISNFNIISEEMIIKKDSNKTFSLPSGASSFFIKNSR